MWTFCGELIEGHADLHPDCTDIVYRITFADDRYYVGKKTVRAKRRYPPLKGKKRVRYKMKDLPFLKYQGSSKETEGLTAVKKEILYQCSGRKTATYLEADYLFTEKALFNDRYINSNIGGKYFVNSLTWLIDDNECLIHLRSRVQ